MNTNYCTMSKTSLMRCNHLEPSLSVRERCSLKRQSIWWAAPPTCCITTNTTNQASASCIPMVTELPQSQGGGDSEVGGKGKQNRGRWRKKRRKRWRGERKSIPSLISRWGFKKQGSFPIGEGGGATSWWGLADRRQQRVEGWGGRMPGLLLSLGPGSTMAPKPLLSGAVGCLWWGVSFCEVHIRFLSLGHEKYRLQLQGQNMFPLLWKHS